MNYRTLTGIVLSLLISGPVCFAAPTNTSRKGVPALHNNEWYIRGKALMKALYESNAEQVKETQKQLKYFVPLVLDKPSSSSSIRAFRALQNLARGMKDELIQLPAPINPKETMLLKLDSILSIIIASANYPGACKTLGTYIIQVAKLPETDEKLTGAKWLLGSLENDHTFATEGASNDAAERAHRLGTLVEEIVRQTLPTTLFQKIMFSFDFGKIEEIRQIFDAMKTHGDYRYISIITSSFKEGFNTFDLGFKKNQAELTQQLISQLINLFCDAVINALTTAETGNHEIALMGEALSAYGQAISTL